MSSIGYVQATIEAATAKAIAYEAMAEKFSQAEDAAAKCLLIHDMDMQCQASRPEPCPNCNLPIATIERDRQALREMETKYRRMAENALYTAVQRLAGTMTEWGYTGDPSLPQ